MAIFEYNDGDHPGGFIGLRVAVSVDGETKQEYFSFKDVSLEEEARLTRLAHKLNSKWLRYQRTAKNKRDREATPGTRDAPHATQVKGISFKNVPCKKIRGGKEKTYYYPELILHISHEGETLTKRYSVRKDGSNLASQWEAAIRALAKHKHLTRWRHLLERCPTMGDLNG
jgi:hypothetical protein